ncbi:MAG TPA: hypothetical protein VEJ87_00605 [Acidimicrobiales bacterium]|nr:hypothetical protein [Acidimicrobiales bacterium]
MARLTMRSGHRSPGRAGITTRMLMAVAALLTVLTVWSRPAGASWSGAGSIPSALSQGEGLGLASYNGDLYAAWLGKSSPYHIWYSAFNGTSWTKQKKIPAALSNFAAAPSLAVYGSDLYAVWIGHASPYHI